MIGPDQAEHNSVHISACAVTEAQAHACVCRYMCTRVHTLHARTGMHMQTREHKQMRKRMHAHTRTCSIHAPEEHAMPQRCGEGEGCSHAPPQQAPGCSHPDAVVAVACMRLRRQV